LQISALYIDSNNATLQAHLCMPLNFHLDFLKKVTGVWGETDSPVWIHTYYILRASLIEIKKKSLSKLGNQISGESPWEANSRSSAQDIPHLLRNLKF
jgi:hypothetical protein